MCARYLLGVEDGSNQKKFAFISRQFHPDDITFSKTKGKWLMVSTLRGMYRQDVLQRWNAPERPVWWGHYRGGTYGQLRQQSNSKIYEKLMDHGAIDEDTKFIDLGSGTMMWCLHMALKTGKPVIGVERTGSTCDGRLITTLLKLDSDEGGWPSSLYKVGLFEADIGLMISL
jgi:hypothetical protein